MALYYASVVGDHDRIVTYWILEEGWMEALQALSKQVRRIDFSPSCSTNAVLQDDLDLYYRFAPVLIQRAPQAAVETFMRQPNLDVRRLIPAMSTPRRPTSEGRTSTEHIIKYLQYSILELLNTDASVHNTLLTLFATDSTVDESELLHFLSASPDNPLTGDPYYDLDYALRLCRSNKRVQACVLIYSKMGLYESSVDLALEHDDLELAKLNADMPEEDDILRKKLWLKIARYVVGQKNDIKTCVLPLPPGVIITDSRL
jgi:hypothetical protein